MPWIRKRFKLNPEIEKQLLAISPRQMDRRLAAKKNNRDGGFTDALTKPGYLLKHHIPVKTDSWDVNSAGFTEVDWVSHSGNSGEGERCSLAGLARGVRIPRPAGDGCGIGRSRAWLRNRGGFFCRRRRQGEDGGEGSPRDAWANGGKRNAVESGEVWAVVAQHAAPLPEGRGEWREVLRLRRRGGGHGGVADGVTVDDELDAAVALAAFGGVIGGDGLVLAEAAGGNGRTGDALLGEKIADGIGAAFGELLIEIVAADAV